MGNRRALLIGPDNYGEGFAPLPAVKHDIELMGSALKASGYEIEICRQDVFSNAAMLDKAMGDFCTIGGPEDIRIVYFTGHGIRGNDNVDSIVPAGTTRVDAFASRNQRVSTDLSMRVAASKVGLVLFIIDACRDKADIPITKGGAPWADSQGLEIPDEHRFVRFLGCAANEVCQILPPASGEPYLSLFTKAFAESVSESNCVSLEQLLPHVERRCTELRSQSISLQPQKPRLSYGELSVEKQRILQRPIFDPIGRAALSTIWESFEPDKLHCLVVLSEHEHQNTPKRGLKDIVRGAISGKTGDKIWKSFRASCNLRHLVSGKRRLLPEAFEPSSVSFGFFSVLDAFASAEALDKAVRAVVEADLVVFDVTHFEPGVMMFIGIRSACCRSLSICSHGDGWMEGQPLPVPFNLQDLNINSHSPPPRSLRTPGRDPEVERFVRRIETGFYQVAKHPGYLDLPAYDALRQLGANYDASSTIVVGERILVLCSYDEKFQENWDLVRSSLTQVLWTKQKISPEIERIIDYGSPQLIWQSLYEQIRRTAACVVDWSDYSPSVFLELGVRLAISEWGAVQIIDENYPPDPENPKNWTQVERMRRLLNPIVYRTRDDISDALEKAGEALLERDPHRDGETDYNRIHRVLLPVIGEIQQARPGLVEEFKSMADALHHPHQGRVAAPQILFHGSRSTKRDSEKAALELRIAAWLYLEYRIKIPKVKGDVSLRELYRELGRSAIDALYDLGDDESIDLAGFIENHLKQVE
jgi:hypothetical protein